MVSEITSIYKIYAVENSIYSTYSSLYIKYIYAVESENSSTDSSLYIKYIYAVESENSSTDVCSSSHYYATNAQCQHILRHYNKQCAVSTFTATL